MIKNVADLLQEFITTERRVLDEFEIAHGPTIGDMYEGLTKSTLQQAIPADLNLQVVSGFATFAGQTSGQIDCMLVYGTGESIPFTDKFKWDVSKVIAVFEVKKTLTEEELADSYNHLKGVSELYFQFAASPQARVQTVDLSLPQRTFSQMTGRAAPEHAQASSLPFHLEILYRTLVTEHIGPVRIVMGHHGWKKEKTLRDHIAKLIEKRLDNPRGMGAGSFPQLIIGGEYSLVKMNGLPYFTALKDSTWPFLASTSHNPIVLMLEMIFTKIDSIFGTRLAYDISNEREALTGCLRAKAIQTENSSGWAYYYDDVPSKFLKERGSAYKWQPSELTLAQFVIMTQLCNGQKVKVDDPNLADFVKPEGGIDKFIQSLIETSLVAIKDDQLVLTTVSCQLLVTRDGKYIAGENNSGQLLLWLADAYPDKETGN